MPVYPIGFSIDETLIVKEVPKKTKLLAHIIPGKLDTYIFNDSEGYNFDYQQSFFAITCKKSGWDCFRHYEILANGCIPLFIDIESIPDTIMTLFPKDMIKETNQLYYLMKNVKSKDEYKKYSDTCYNYIEKLLEYTRTYLTTESMASYVLSKSNIKINGDTRVLFLSEKTDPDYLRCLTLQGFKKLFGTKCHDFPKIEHIYDDYSEDVKKIYGKGINYTKLIKNELYDKSLDKDISKNIKNRYYDVVIYGSVHRGIPLHSFVQQYYKQNEIIYMCGEDEHDCQLKNNKSLSTFFIRELK